MIAIGSLACFYFYRLSPIDSVFTNVSAMINYSKDGQAITYLAQGAEFIIMPALLFFLKMPLQCAKALVIEEIYCEVLKEPAFSSTLFK